MIGYWIASGSPHYHPSVVCVAGSPKGRAVAPANFGLGPSKKVAKARSAASMWSVLPIIVIIPICFVALLLSGTPSLTIWLLGLFGPLIGLLTFTHLDRFFWLIQRAHDMGKSWIWVGLPALIIAAVPTVGFVGMIWLPVETVAPIMLGGLVLILVPAGLVLLWIMYGQSQEGENRYGPPAEPIPDYWSE